MTLQYSLFLDKEANGTRMDMLSTLTNSFICGIGSSFPRTTYTQHQLQNLLGIENTVVKKLLSSDHIQTRQLYLPNPTGDNTRIDDEDHMALHDKFNNGVADIGVSSVINAISRSSISISDLQFIICVTSTGFRVPGISSMISRALSLRSDVYRLDIVGMGCNGGMSALRAGAALSATGLTGIIVCCEINSACYVRDETINTGIVNSLFGDGAACVVISPPAFNGKIHRPADTGPCSRIEMLSFSSHTMHEHYDAMKFDWDDSQSKWSFFLSKEIPFVVGRNLHRPVLELLQKTGVSREEIKHWILHTGGGAVINGAMSSLNISEHDVRHTRSVLRDHGNISSGSFLVSLERLLKEGSARDGDLGIMIAMGPGATFEACLFRYHLLD